MQYSSTQTTKEPQRITGEVNTIRFKDDISGFKIINITVTENGAGVGWATLKGTMPFVTVGREIAATGYWVDDPKYGRQFAVQYCEDCMPSSAAAIREYLASSYVKGIGPSCAEAIVKKFGTRTLDVIDNTPEKLLQVNGIGPVRLEQIKSGWKEFTKTRDLMMFLQQHGISPVFASRIYKAYGDSARRKIQENPYRLADDIDGIGFLKADAIAEKFGIPKDSQMRLRSGIIYTLKECSSEGHCYLTRDELTRRSAALLEVETISVEICLNRLFLPPSPCREITLDTDYGEARYYLSRLYNAEKGSARQLKRIMAGAAKKNIDPDKAEKIAAWNGDVAYNNTQLNAVRQAAGSKVSILTGGPGTGKTTTILGIIKAFEAVDAEILLAAPTGRAAKRMSEACGMEAKTIHRLLEYNPSTGGFYHNENDPLEGDVLILDECSMIDIQLFYSLLKAVPGDMRVILVGDADQLPSVGPGNVFKDLIGCGKIPVTRLDYIYRQNEKSTISELAHRVNSGKKLDLTGDPAGEFTFVEIEEPERIAAYIADLYEYFIKNGAEDVQILSPMKKGPVGTAALNNAVQARINPSGSEFKTAGYVLRVKDRVMQMRNDYDKNVFNGDIGIVSRIDKESNELECCMDGNRVVYDVQDIDELSLAYATTIHKSQGSEYQIVIMPATISHYVMLQRNLLYTGITRAKRKLVIVGTKKAVYTAVSNDKTKKRNTALAARLMGDEEKK